MTDPDVAKCCMDRANRVEVSRAGISADSVKQQERCGVCGRNHYIIEGRGFPTGIIEPSQE